VTTSGTVDELAGSVERWAKSWFIGPTGEDLLSLDSLPIGWALHIEVADAVLAAIRPIIGQPARVVGRPVFQGLKRRGLDRAMRAWGLRAVAPMSFLVRPRRSNVAIISELSTPSTLDGLIDVANQISNRPAIGVADPRALRRWRSAGHQVNPLLLSPTAEFRRLRSLRGSVQDLWHAASSQPPSLRIDGVDHAVAAIRAVRPVVRHSLPWVVIEAAAIRSFLEDSGPHTVFVATDQHRIGRLATHVATTLGIRSIVLQHGLPQATLGYLPLAADRLAAWSEASAEWFIDRGTSADRVSVVGNPRLDWLHTRDRLADRALVDQRLETVGDPRILLALSVSSVHSNRRLVETTLEALARLPSAALVIKLHPGGSDWREVLRQYAWNDEVRRRTKVIDRSPVEPLLGWADIVVVHRSTVAGEAMAAERPVIVVETGEPSIATAELATLGLTSVRDGTELSKEVTRLADPVTSQQYVASRRQALERVMGPLDGRSADRAARLIEDDQPGR
jgi:glycosyltransferase involved in cell wall biosynthesis